MFKPLCVCLYYSKITNINFSSIFFSKKRLHKITSRSKLEEEGNIMRKQLKT